MIPFSKLSEYVAEPNGSLMMIPREPALFEQDNPDSRWYPSQSMNGLKSATHTSLIEVPVALEGKLKAANYCVDLVIEKRSVTGTEDVKEMIPVYDENGSFQWKPRPLEVGETVEYDVLVDVIPTGYTPPVREETEPVNPLQARVDALEEALTATQMALCDMYENK